MRRYHPRLSAMVPAGVGGLDRGASVSREIRRERSVGSTDDGAREAREGCGGCSVAEQRGEIGGFHVEKQRQK